jgi:hypothetical protein
LLLEGALILDGHSLPANSNTFFKLACGSAVVLSSLSRPTTASGECISGIISSLVLDVVAQVVSGHLAHFLGGKLSLLVLARPIALFLAAGNEALLMLLRVVVIIDT